LTARGVMTSGAGRHNDGGGLHLKVKETGSRSWLFCWKVGGKRHAMGLGPFPAISLAQARELARKCREGPAGGKDPKKEFQRARVSGLTFGEAADQLIESKAPSWRSTKHAAQWQHSLQIVCKSLRDKTVAEITTEDVLAVLKPLWQMHHESASR